MAASAEATPAILNDADYAEATEAFIALDDNVREVAQRMRPIRAKHRALRALLGEYMQKTQRPMCYINGGEEVLVAGVRNKDVRLNGDAAVAKMARALNGDAVEAKRVFDFVYGDPEQEEKSTFTRKKSDFGKQSARAAPAETDPRAALYAQRLADARLLMDEQVRGAQAFSF